MLVEGNIIPNSEVSQEDRLVITGRVEYLRRFNRLNDRRQNRIPEEFRIDGWGDLSFYKKFGFHRVSFWGTVTRDIITEHVSWWVQREDNEIDIAEFSRRFESDGQGFGRRTIPFILVVVKNPEAYIEKTTKKTLQRKKLYSNLKWYGTPLVFEARDYKMSAREILTLLNDKLERYKAWQSQNNALSSPF